jgi:hypothetical protein
MIIGTVRPEEARVFDQYAGYHSFHAEETQEPYGSFEIFWHDAEEDKETGEGWAAGWFWAAGSPGCLWDSEPVGPFASSRQALEDADEWHPEFD